VPAVVGATAVAAAAVVVAAAVPGGRVAQHRFLDLPLRQRQLQLKLPGAQHYQCAAFNDLDPAITRSCRQGVILGAGIHNDATRFGRENFIDQ
jgi:hypothetical protein